MYKKFKKNDFCILNEMVKNGYTKPKKIAQLLNISEKTVRNRINLMEKEGVFKRQVVVNPAYFGYNIRFDIFFKVDTDITRIIDLITTKYPFNILYAGTHWGDDDLSLQTVFKKAHEVATFRKDCQSLPGVKIKGMTMVPVVYKDIVNWIAKPSNFQMNEADLKKFNSTEALKFERERFKTQLQS